MPAILPAAFAARTSAAVEASVKELRAREVFARLARRVHGPEHRADFARA